MLMSSLSEPKTNVTDERAGHSGPPTQRGSEKKEPVTDVAGSMVAEIGLARLSNNDNKDWEVGCDLSVFTSEATALRSSSCRCCCKTAVLTVAWGVPAGLLMAVVALLVPNALSASLVRVRTLEVQTLSLAARPPTMPALLLGGPPPRTPPRRAAVAIMCDSHEPLMSNVSAPVFLEELDRPGGALDGQSARFTVAQPGCCASKEEAA